MDFANLIILISFVEFLPRVLKSTSGSRIDRIKMLCWEKFIAQRDETTNLTLLFSLVLKELQNKYVGTTFLSENYLT